MRQICLRNSSRHQIKDYGVGLLAVLVELISQKGSHRKWRNIDRQLQVIVPYHKGRDLPMGTLRNIMTGADIPESEWKTE